MVIAYAKQKLKLKCKFHRRENEKVIQKFQYLNSEEREVMIIALGVPVEI